LQGKAAFIPAAISTCLIVWAYFRLPETAGKTPEDLDLLFEEKVPARQFAKYDTTELKARAHMSAFA
jgi:SP family general alpha glucoside:H+ symporter-like MFS transporter